MFQLNLSPEQMRTLAGLLDAAIKTVGIRAMEDDVVELMRVIKNAAPVVETDPDEGGAP
jgi:hypothetical protein